MCSFYSYLTVKDLEVVHMRVSCEHATKCCIPRDKFSKLFVLGVQPLPQTPPLWGRDTPPHTIPVDAFGVSMSLSKMNLLGQWWIRHCDISHEPTIKVNRSERNNS